ncbi:MAG: Mrp/NBP35 family ATP-binding protein [Promethearchaeota archaeon]
MNEKDDIGVKLKDSPTLDRRKQILELEKRIKENMEQISHKIAIISGKGGVGKTTVAANLAIRFAMDGNVTGALDVDITGPNLHKLLSLKDRPGYDDKIKAINPVIGPYNIKVMSMAFLLDSDYTPVIWRGPMKMGVVREFLGTVNWGNLDYLIIDLPPGTGDETLDIMQLVKPLDGVIIVTTSQEMSLIDVAKTINMAGKMNVKVLGLIENMSIYKCPKCGHVEQIFGEKDAAKNLAKRFSIPFLGSIPLEPSYVQQLRDNLPVILQDKESAAKQALEDIFSELNKLL